MGLFDTSLEARVFDRLCDEMATPYAYKLSLRARRGDWGFVAENSPRPDSYTCIDTYWRDVTVHAFLRKHPGVPTGRDLEAIAREKFLGSQRMCFQTNERLSPLTFDPGHYGAGVRRIISLARKEVRRILGRAPALEDLNPRFGPGATFDNRSNLTMLYDKLSDGYTATDTVLRYCSKDWDQTAWSRYAAACPTFREGFVLDEPDPHYAIRDFRVVRGNRFTSVPKDSRSNRGICIEPSLNLFYQLGVGEEMEKRLGRSCGWYKTNIQDTHRELARLGSINGKSLTLDLSNASDTICTTLVRLLLPADWYILCHKLRSPWTLLPRGGWVKNEMFSSMGNGFTFELETILFRGITVAVTQACLGIGTAQLALVSTFGDDIIAPVEIESTLISCLRFLGFETNKEKTFGAKSDFRESCGGDYYRGCDVRPFHLKKSLSDPASIISCINGLNRSRLRHESFTTLCPRYDSSRWLLTKLPRAIARCVGPSHLGDVVIHDDVNVDRWTTTVRSSIRYVRVWRPVQGYDLSLDHFRPHVVLAAALYLAGEPSRYGIDDPGRTPKSATKARVNGSFVTGYRFGRVPCS